ncbi:hypothetical protein [Dictyobacter kobayashii]|uniref:Uncharacterized protein n=1 Tax=Dictyobacter kobayashii TaxID=2014872 RepID=A0A402AG72_9CHLR|nr:hypothetical protein [Dictyobacter kobayashii]GCE18089.1 hypothetical protein KDK_18890 [Dictyobacter kobayashii]
MKDAMHSGESVVVVQHNDDTRKRRSRAPQYCSICTARIWFDPIDLVEPEGVPEPRLSWVLCKACHQSLQIEMNRSPVRSPLRLRIAMGMVATERWPHAYSTRVREYINDRRLVLFIAIGLIVAMVLHLILIVMIAGLK